MADDDFLRRTMPAMDLVYNIARRMVPRPEDAEDLVQETYLAAYRAWLDGRAPKRVEPWLATICLNLGRSGFRHRARRPPEVPWETQDLVAGVDVEAEAIGRVDRRAVHGALWQLPDEQRIAITLVDLVGLSTAETAAAMGTPRGTVLSRLHRGRRALAVLLAEHVEEQA
ncbi:MAG: sigma-70 family RNA polymerase sigma factor [Actinobacteria bacterium]|nr:sigma-70 family RNA polymerase sigma factor [Actinomycetota bacterium]